MALATIALTLAQIEVVWKIVVVDRSSLQAKMLPRSFSLVTNSARDPPSR
jgi:hypothetical protein